MHSSSLAPAPGALIPPGTSLGKFKILRQLAVGGMAELYLAQASGLEGFQKQIVLKRVLPHLAADDAIVGMFLQEARLAATLHHPNIVQVYEMGIAAGSYFFTMEYVPGIDVRTVFRITSTTGESIPFEFIIAIGAAAAAGLHHAHEQRTSDGRPLGIVHRDVSPSNLIVSVNGVVKVIDFGIAQAQIGHAETRTGSTKGKITYMSPEQCKGATLDRRSDIFSLGIVLHELTSGQRLFATGSDYDTMTKIVSNETPLLSSLRDDCPAEFAQIVARCLERDPAKRFTSAELLQLALEGMARERRLDISSVALGQWMQRLAESDAVASAHPPITLGLPLTATAAAHEDSNDVRVHEGAPIAGERSPRPAKVLLRWVGAAVGTAVLAGAAVLMLQHRVASVKPPRPARIEEPEDHPIGVRPQVELSSVPRLPPEITPPPVDQRQVLLPVPAEVSTGHPPTKAVVLRQHNVTARHSRAIGRDDTHQPFTTTNPSSPPASAETGEQKRPQTSRAPKREEPDLDSWTGK